MDDIKQSISNYLESSDGFALLIDGGWGTGKTHFIQNELLDDLDNIDEYSNNKTSIYTSLYGQESVGEIKKIITTQLLNIVQSDEKSFLKGATALASYIDIPVIDIPKISGDFLNYMDAKSISTIQMSLAKNENRFVIVIDDLERITDVNEVNELFGFIRNELLDTLKLKVILIGNMNELNNRFNKEIGETKFNKSKEKVIGKSIEFVNNVGNGINLIKENLNGCFEVDPIRNDLETFLAKSELIDESKRTFDERVYKSQNSEIKDLNKFTNNPLNLRTLKLVISDYKTIYKVANEEIKDDMSEDIKISIFYSLFIINNEFRNGNFDDRTIDTLLKYISPFEDDTKFIYARYYQNENVKRLIYMHRELLNYVLYNRADLSKYVQDLNKHINTLDQTESALDKLEKREFDSELELNQYLNNAIAEFRAINKVAMKLHYLVIFMILEDEGLFISSENTDDLLNELIDSYDLEQYKTLRENLSTSTNLQMRNYLSKKMEIKKRLQEKEAELIKVDEVEFLQAIFNNDQSRIREIKSISFTRQEPNVYQYILDNKTLVERSFEDSIQSARYLNAYLVNGENILDVTEIGEHILQDYIEYMERVKEAQEDIVKQHFIGWLVTNAKRRQQSS